MYNSLILTAHCASSQAPRRRRLSRVFHGRLLHFMSISAHFRVMGIGVFFYTRKGSFLYKISLYIITYHVAIIVYHCVSLSISQYIMSLGDT